MTARKVFGIITMVLFVYLIINIFIPMDTNGNTSLWRTFELQGQDPYKGIALLILLAFGLIVCVLQLCGVIKDFKYAAITAGIYLSNYLYYMYVAFDRGFSGLGYGFWAGIIFPIVTLLMIFIGNLLNNNSKPKQYQRVVKVDGPPIKGYDPNTGEPIYAKIKKYDPNTGKPIYE